MAHLGASQNKMIREYVAPTALGLGLVICMPVLGIAAILMRGTLIAAFAVCVAVGVTIAAWHMIEPTLSPRWRHAVRELALGVAMIVSLPLLAVVLFVMQGTVAALFAVAAVALTLVGIWRIFAAGGQVLHTR